MTADDGKLVYCPDGKGGVVLRRVRSIEEYDRFRHEAVIGGTTPDPGDSGMTDTHPADPYRELREAADGILNFRAHAELATMRQAADNLAQQALSILALLAERDRLALANAGMAVEYDHEVRARRLAEAALRRARSDCT